MLSIVVIGRFLVGVKVIPIITPYFRIQYK